MRIYEYQAKQLLNAAGICPPAGFVTEHSNVVAIRAKCMGPRLVVKAKVHAGGRPVRCDLVVEGEPSACHPSAVTCHP
jgi:succinyl-CoA synthetase beta subunit